MRASKQIVPRAKKQKIVYGTEYQIFLRMLRAARQAAGLTQEQVAERLKQAQTYVSRSERGEHRVDIAELYYFCQVYGVRFTDFMAELEAGFQSKRTTPNTSEE